MAKGNIAKTSNQGNQSEQNGEYIKVLVVMYTDFNEIHFRLKMTTEMSKVKKAYAERLGAAQALFRFSFDGKWINDDDTPQQLGMEEGDVILVYPPETESGSF